MARRFAQRLHVYDEELKRLSPLLAATQLRDYLKPAQLLSDHAKTVIDPEGIHSQQLREQFLVKFKEDRKVFIDRFYERELFTSD